MQRYQLAGPAATTVAEYKGTPQTLLMMARYALGAEGEANHYVRQWAETLVSKVSPKDYLSEILAIHDWGTGPAIRYTNDAKHVEQVKTPFRMLKEIAEQGSAMLDCDDIATLLASMLMTLGREVEFVIVGFKEGGDFTHVFIRVKEPKTGAWIVVDPVAGQNDVKMLRNTKKWATCAVEPGRLTIVPGDKSMKPIIVDDTFMSGFGGGLDVSVNASVDAGDAYGAAKKGADAMTGGGGKSAPAPKPTPAGQTPQQYCSARATRVNPDGSRSRDSAYYKECTTNDWFRVKTMQPALRGEVESECAKLTLSPDGSWRFPTHKKCLEDVKYRSTLRAQRQAENELKETKARNTYNLIQRQKQEKADAQNKAISAVAKLGQARARAKADAEEKAKVAALEAQIAKLDADNKRLAAGNLVAGKISQLSQAGAFRMINPATGKGANTAAAPMTQEQIMAAMGLMAKSPLVPGGGGAATPTQDQPPIPEAQPPMPTDLVPTEPGMMEQVPTEQGYPEGAMVQGQPSNLMQQQYGQEVGPGGLPPVSVQVGTPAKEEPNYPLYIGAAAVVLVGLYLVTRK